MLNVFALQTRQLSPIMKCLELLIFIGELMEDKMNGWFSGFYYFSQNDDLVAFGAKSGFGMKIK